MDNIVIVEFGTYIAGPLTSKHLMDALGATVISITRPRKVRGVIEESQWFPNVHKYLREGKDIFEIDLKTSPEIAWEYIKNADILIENFRPGVMNKLGFDPASCRKVKPSLIYVSLPGFASTDQELSDIQAWESVILAMSGVFKDMGINRQLMNIPASYSPLPLASVYASVFAAFSISACVFRDLRLKKLGMPPKGDVLEIPLASALMDALIHNSIHFAIPDVYKDLRKRKLMESHPALSYTEVNNLMDPFYSHYFCADDRPFYLVGLCHINHQTRALEVLGLYDTVIAMGLPITDTYQTGTHIQHGLGSMQVGDKWTHVLKKMMADEFRKMTAFEWEEKFGKAGIPCAAHRTTCEWLQSTHAIESGLVFSNHIKDIRPAPIAWFHTDAHAFPSASNAIPKFTKPPPLQCLDEIQILDLSNVIAGPTIGTMLARCGANVIKLDHPNPTYDPLITIIYGAIANIGKKSILVDIKTPKGWEIFKELIKKTDIIVVNATTECLKRLCLTAKELQTINPHIIITQFDAWSGIYENFGSMSQYLGYDDNIQAALGIMTRFGGGIDTVEEHAHVGTVDVVAGVAGAFASVCALIHHYRTNNRSIVARTSLASLGQMVQLPFVCGNKNELLKLEKEYIAISGPMCKGEHAYHQCYKTSDDQWILLYASFLSPENWRFDSRIHEKFENILNINKYKLGLLSNETIQGHLEEYFAKSLTQDVLKELRQCGIVAVILNSMKNLRHKYYVSVPDVNGPTFQFLTHLTHPIGPLTMVAPVGFRFRTTPQSLVLPNAPKYGLHTKEILKTIGFKPDSVVAKSQWSHNYLPYSNECPVCQQWIHQHINLNCGHIVCQGCYMKASLHGKCPICKNMSADNLKSEWFSKYRQWRQGSNHGSKNEIYSPNPNNNPSQISDTRKTGDIINYIKSNK